LPLKWDTGVDDSKKAVTRRYLPNSPFKAPPVPDVEEYEVGDRVMHDTFGIGRVTALEGKFAVHVDFTPRLERITLPCTKMTAL
jgi:hypothetical protein